LTNTEVNVRSRSQLTNTEVNDGLAGPS